MNFWIANRTNLVREFPIFWAILRGTRTWISTRGSGDGLRPAPFRGAPWLLAVGFIESFLHFLCKSFLCAAVAKNLGGHLVVFLVGGIDSFDHVFLGDGDLPGRQIRKGHLSESHHVSFRDTEHLSKGGNVFHLNLLENNISRDQIIVNMFFKLLRRVAPTLLLSW